MKLNKLALSEIGNFYRQIAVMLKSGVALPDAVLALQSERSLPKIRKKISNLHQKMTTNHTSFEDVIKTQSDLFNPALINILISDASNEVKGDALVRFAEAEERSFQYIKKTAAALIYPLITLSTAVVVVFILLVFVIPVFSEMFEGMGAALPKPTLFVIEASDFLIRYVFYFLLVGIAITAAFLINKKLFYWIVSKVPGLGAVTRKIAIMSFTDYFALLLLLDIPFKSAIDNAAQSVRDPYYSSIFRQIADKASSIGELYGQVKGTSLFPVMLVKSVEYAKTPQSLGKVMAEVAQFYNEDFRKGPDKIVEVVEPFLLIFLGILIGGFVIAMYLPIFQMAGPL